VRTVRAAVPLELEDERREQIVQLLVELLEHFSDEPATEVGSSSDEGRQRESGGLHPDLDRRAAAAVLAGSA